MWIFFGCHASSFECMAHVSPPFSNPIKWMHCHCENICSIWRSMTSTAQSTLLHIVRVRIIENERYIAKQSHWFAYVFDAIFFHDCTWPNTPARERIDELMNVQGFGCVLSVCIFSIHIKWILDVKCSSILHIGWICWYRWEFPQHWRELVLPNRLPFDRWRRMCVISNGATIYSSLSLALSLSIYFARSNP